MQKVNESFEMYMEAVVKICSRLNLQREDTPFPQHSAKPRKHVQIKSLRIHLEEIDLRHLFF